MNPSNEDQKPVDNMELLKQQASGCGPGCDCHATGPSGRRRWILGMIVLLAAAALVARAVVKSNAASTQLDPAAFSAWTVALTPGTDGVSATPPAEAAMVSGPVVGQEIAAISELNTAATGMNAVFIFLPAKGQSATGKAVNGIEAARRTIESNGAAKIGVFTLKIDCPDYSQMSQQFTPPGVITLVKGRGARAVTGEITETKLVQAFLAASSASAGGAGCCGPSGCCPAGSK
jgi:MYXO-CTERM domain-containing protein